MGKKSDKKFKSDRVNALRKQYDAFLEEDRKRKERNEYILGRLDNMRYTTTAVQIRHKIGYADLVPTYNRVTYRPDDFERRDIQTVHPNQQISRATHQNLQLDVPRKYLDESSLLKEISKNYILIPKLRPSLTNDYVGTIPPQSLPPVMVTPSKANTISNEDWKSKYDILEQLKKKEKEENTNKYGKDELIPVKESQTLRKDDLQKFNNGRESSLGIDGYDSQKAIDAYELQNYNAEDFDAKYEHEVPEKDLSSDKIKTKNEPLNLELSKTNGSTDQKPCTDHDPMTSSGTIPNIHKVDDHTLLNQDLEHNLPIVESVINTNNIEENVKCNDYSEDTILPSEYNTEKVPHVYNDSEHQLNEDVQQEEYPVEYEQPMVDEGKYPDPKKDYLDPNDYSPIEVINPIEITNKVHNEEFTQEQEAVEYPVEMLNPQEFTPEADVKLEDGVNVDPIYMASEETNEPVYETNPDQVMGVELTEEPQDSSGIEAFDAEQTEMFYPEQTQEYAYDQQGDGYTQPAESYPQTEEYAYYENTTESQEPEYPAEINEQEETSSRYDPNYEQQYANPYEQQAYEQGQEEQQYAPPAEGYEQPQQQYDGYEYEQPDHDTVQSIEQVLDNEQGYEEKHNLEANDVEKTEQHEGIIQQ